jgi:hypothetical protein
MTHLIFRGLRFAAIIAAAAVGGSLATRAQQVAGPPDVTTALLIEVRGLRAALEEMATAGPRVQLLFGRVQLQEQRIINQVRRHDAVMADLAGARKRLEPLTDQIKMLSKVLTGLGLEPESRREFEAELAARKTEWERANADVQRLVAEEALLAQEVAAEQTRWTDFNQRLEELERTLARR